MAENRLKKIHDFGQSIWLDNIRKGLISSGELQRLIDEDGLRGVTSNPTIFEKAVDGSKDYDEILSQLVKEERSLDEIYEAVVTGDIRAAAAVLKPVFDQSGGSDGFVSLELPADMAMNTEKSIAEARRLHELLNLPNLMVKIPATRAGVPAIKQMISEGRNINVTLIFSRKRYQEVMEAYISGLEARAEQGKPLDSANSVASFFVSRIDVAVDALLEEKLKDAKDDAQRQKIQGLLGKAAIANAKVAYQLFKDTFGSERFQKLKAKGAKVQRPLWASTSTKNPNYRDVLYMEALIGPDTVDTVPPATLVAFRDHGEAANTIEQGVDEAKKVLAALEEVGIDLEEVTANLERDGVKQFSESMDKLMHSFAVRREELLGDLIDRQTAVLPGLEKPVADRLQKMQEEDFGRRYWEKDAKLWKDDEASAKSVRSRLGWMTTPETMQECVPAIQAFVSEVKRAGFTHAVVLGMGGSSLCPEALSRTFTKAPGYPRLLVLDSTHPDAVAEIEQEAPLDTTLFIVSSKSGGTIEPNSFYRYFRNRLEAKGADSPGGHFIAITDPGTSLERMAEDEGFRKAWINPPDIGGRYSALSYFGLVPAALMGIDVGEMLETATRMLHSCDHSIQDSDNPGLALGAILAEAAAVGRDKVTLVSSETIRYFGAWAEQLIAESTGKEGKGLVPVDDETLGPPEIYGKDRIFVNIQLCSDPSQDEPLQPLEDAGHLVVRILMEDPLALGEEFYRWEMAIGAAGAIMGINSFDEPNVQESKDNTKKMLETYQSTGALPEEEPLVTEDGIALYTNDAEKLKADGSLAGALQAFLSQVKTGDYVAFMAYVPPSDAAWWELQQARLAVRDNKKVATTLGYGPRFLHSTGQLHKGGPPTGVFLQITAAPRVDLPIPGQPYSFGVLVAAQAAGDEKGLRDHGLRVIRLHLQNGDADLIKLPPLFQKALSG